MPVSYTHLDIVWEGVSLAETPRFAYRGTRYFAHRSLHRFQAEMWGPGDWEQMCIRDRYGTVRSFSLPYRCTCYSDAKRLSHSLLASSGSDRIWFRMPS